MENKISEITFGPNSKGGFFASIKVWYNSEKFGFFGEGVTKADAEENMNNTFTLFMKNKNI